MNVSLKWLSDHVDFSDYSMEQLDELLTFSGIEVEGIQSLPDKVVAAEVLSSEKHPDADKLSVCQVDDGSGSERQIVCGASNYEVGDKVPLALPGCELDGGDGKRFAIKEGKLRGVKSLGMMCSASELGLEDEADGLMILPGDIAPGTPLREVFPAVLELEITPNRPDCLSHLGTARELAALVQRDLKGVSHHGDSKTKTRKATKEEIVIESDNCPYYTGRWIRGVEVKESPAWLKEKLVSIGLRPINNIVDITNYVLMEMGQPLHAFDLAKLDGGIIVRQAEHGEKMKALDEEEYVLSDTDLVIADRNGAIAIGGVMGGEDSGVTEGTTDILLEAAYFVPSAVRRTARTLGIQSDSSYRFERGVDPHQVKGASDLAVRLIVDLAGGTADPELVEAGKIPAPPEPVPLDHSFCRKVIGAEISDEEIDHILASLGLKKGAGAWEIPTFRLDLERPIDLVEEVARVYGLDKVPSETVARFAESSRADAEYDFARSIQCALASLGFFETRNLKLISGEQLEDDRATNHRGMSPIRLKNPLNDEQDYLRPGLLPGLLASAGRNVRFGNPNLRLFEVGRVYVESPKGDSVEQEHLALLMTGARTPANWANNKPGDVDIHDLRSTIEAMLGSRAGKLVLNPVEDDRLLGAASIEFGRGKKAIKLGLAGYLPPARGRAFDIETPIAVAELNLRKLATAIKGDFVFEELPRFPGSSRDIAMVVPDELPNESIAAFFANYSEALLVEAKLFDVFRDGSGEKLDADKKSVAYTLLYRCPDRTLEAHEVEEAHGRLLKALRKELPVEFR